MRTLPPTDRTNAASSGRGLLTTYRWLSSLLALGILIQAVLASQGLFKGKPDLISGHGMLGNLLLLIAVVIAGIAIAGRGKYSPPLDTGAVARGIVLVVLIVIQIMLGYATRDSSTAIAWHIPNGVLLMGISAVNAAMAWANPHRTRHAPLITSLAGTMQIDHPRLELRAGDGHDDVGSCSPGLTAASPSRLSRHSRIRCAWSG